MKDKDFKEIEKIVKKDGYNLTKYKKYLNNKSLIFKAANTYGSIIKYVDKKYRKNKELIKKCVSNDPYAFRYVDKRLQQDELLIKESLKYENTRTNAFSATMMNVGKNIKSKKLAIYAINKRGNNYNFLNRVLRDDFNLLIYALKKDGAAFWGAKKAFQRNIDVVNLAKKTGIIQRYPKISKLPFKVPEDIFFYFKDKERKNKDIKKDVEEHRLYSGGLFWGTLLNDRPDGYGKFFNDDPVYPVEYKGMWRKGKFNGKGFLTNYNEGSDTLWWTYEGEFKNSEAYGKGKKITYQLDGKGIYQIEEGNFKKDFPDGKIKVIENGKKYFNIYKNGRLIKIGNKFV